MLNFGGVIDPIKIEIRHGYERNPKGALHGQIEAEAAQALLAACMEDVGVNP